MRTHQLRVLVVDDDEDFLLLWRLRLQDDPRIARVYAATDGAEAMREVARTEVDIVLADAWMPTSGFELAESVGRSHPGLPVVLTSCAEGADREAHSRGAAMYLEKWRTVSSELPDLLCTVAAAAQRTPSAA